MSLVWRLLPHARPWKVTALVVGSILLSAAGCKSGGGWWSPGSSKWGSTESSTSDLAVSRPPTRVPKPSSTASPSSAGSIAASGAQNGPYGSGNSTAAATQPRSGYGSQPADWQGEPHSSVAPAGGYQTGGQYAMAANSRPQPGVTPALIHNRTRMARPIHNRTPLPGDSARPMPPAPAQHRPAIRPARSTRITASPAGRRQRIHPSITIRAPVMLPPPAPPPAR
jgi:hypothetical protein